MSRRQNITNCRFYLRAGRSGLESPQWQEALSNKPSKLALVPTQTSTHWLPDFFPWSKRPGRQTDSSPSTSAKVKCEWRHICSPSAYIHVFFVVNIVILSDILAIWACFSCNKNYTDLCLPGLPASQRKIKSSAQGNHNIYISFRESNYTIVNIFSVKEIFKYPWSCRLNLDISPGSRRSV
jgi:hypothetical protein